MNDQAVKLRSLMQDAPGAHASGTHSSATFHGRYPDQSRGPVHVVAVCGAKAGAGATTTAHSMAAAYQRTGHRTAVLDFQANEGRRAAKYDASNAGLYEVLCGQASWREVLYPGDENIFLLAASHDHPDDAHWRAALQPDLAAKLQELSAWVDVCLLDLGAGSHALLADCWNFAQEVVLVTTPERLAIMDAYAAIKALGPPDGAATLRVVVNRASERQRRAVDQRLQLTCSRFLNLRIDEVLAAPADARLRSAATASGLCISEPLAARLQSCVMRGGRCNVAATA